LQSIAPQKPSPAADWKVWTRDSHSNVVFLHFPLSFPRVSDLSLFSPVHENVRALASSTLAKDGTILLPWGRENTVILLVSGEDVARVAAGALTSPSVSPGSAYPVIGEVLKLRDIVATFSRVLRREVRYQEIPDKLWYNGALARGLNQHAVDHLSQLWRVIRTGTNRFEVTDTIEKLGGRKPKAFEKFVRDEQDAFTSQTIPKA
jgi:hypothetical protein